MTAAEVRQLSRGQRETLWASLKADRLPVGTYDGRTWPVSVWPFWRGKVFRFEGAHVKNRIGPFRLFRGYCSLDNYDYPINAVINYPQLGLVDYLKPVSDSLWLGYLRLGPFKIWFILEAVP